MKPLGIWTIVLLSALIAGVFILNIDDLRSVIDEKSMW